MLGIRNIYFLYFVFYIYFLYEKNFKTFAFLLYILYRDEIYTAIKWYVRLMYGSWQIYIYNT